MKCKLVLFFFLFSQLALSSTAAVKDATALGFTIESNVKVAAPPQKAFDDAVRKLGRWWDPAHTFSGQSGNLTLDPVVGGCFCESWGDNGVEHGRVIFIRNAEMLRLRSSLGPLQEHAVTGVLSFTFSSEGNSTRLTLRYSAGGYVPGGLESWAVPVDSVLSGQLTRLQKFIETGSPE